MFISRDILLLEAGILSILVAPLRYRSLSRRRTASSSPSDNIAFWLVRWLLFRLMFTSGVVKLTSECPTWWGLTGNVAFVSVITEKEVFSIGNYKYRNRHLPQINIEEASPTLTSHFPPSGTC